MSLPFGRRDSSLLLILPLSASPFNYPAPGKRPLSSTSPLIMDSPDGETYLALGGSGGSRIFGSVAQVILNLDWGYDVANAVEQPRVHDQLSPAYVSRVVCVKGERRRIADAERFVQVSVESGFRTDLVEELESRGHNVTYVEIGSYSSCRLSLTGGLHLALYLAAASLTLTWASQRCKLSSEILLAGSSPPLILARMGA